MNPATWAKDSGVAFHSRSPQLRAIDVALATYASGKNKTTLYALTDAFLDWYGKAPDFNWLDSVRKKHMIELVNYIKTEAAIIVPTIKGYVFNRRLSKRMIAQMLAAPEPFLRKYPISIAGAADSPAYDYRVSVDSMDALFGDGQLSNMSVYGPVEKINLWTAPYGAKLTTLSINMHTDIVAASTAADVLGKFYPVNAGAVVATGRLTGCSFLIRTAAGLQCTHIKPVGQTGLALQAQLDGFNMPSVRVYGIRDYTNLYTNIIGFNQGGWKIYSQRSDASTVHTLDRIHP